MRRCTIYRRVAAARPPAAVRPTAAYPPRPPTLSRGLYIYIYIYTHRIAPAARFFLYYILYYYYRRTIYYIIMYIVYTYTVFRRPLCCNIIPTHIILYIIYRLSLTLYFSSISNSIADNIFLLFFSSTLAYFYNNNILIESRSACICTSYYIMQHCPTTSAILFEL